MKKQAEDSDLLTGDEETGQIKYNIRFVSGRLMLRMEKHR